MPRYLVKEERSVTLTHVIEADSAEEAESRMGSGTTKGLVDILEDDCETEYTTTRLYKEGDKVSFHQRVWTVIQVMDNGWLLRIKSGRTATTVYAQTVNPIDYKETSDGE